MPDNLLPSLAFTALLEWFPGYGGMDGNAPETKALLTDLTAAMQVAYEQRHPDLFAFAQDWIAERVAA